MPGKQSGYMVAFVAALLLLSCSRQEPQIKSTESQITLQVSAPGNPVETPTQSPTVLRTRVSSLTPEPESYQTIPRVVLQQTEPPGLTPSLQIAQATPQSSPTWNINRLTTATRNPAAICPNVTPKPAKTPIFSKYYMQEDGQPLPSTDEEINLFLTDYGVQPILRKDIVASNQILPAPIVAYQDFTNDGIPEVIIIHRSSLRIYGCNAERYQKLFELGPDGYLLPPVIVAIDDLNRNGIPEIYMRTGIYTQGGADFGAIEWDGNKFNWIITNANGTNSVHVAPGYLTFDDIDHDGIKEVVVISKVPIWSDYPSGLPWRDTKEIYKWDGETFMFHREIMAPPIFRFQAVQDGDRSVIEQDYSKALDLYQQAIFSDKLEWYSAARQETMRQQWGVNFSNPPVPAPTLPAADPLEYDNLAAYATYRIMLLHIEHGYFSDAKAVYDGLLKKYPEGSNGSIYGKLAQAFWNEFTATKRIGNGCQKALDFAVQNWDEVTKYLGYNWIGEDHFGWQGLKYASGGNMICPFR
jgi:hypothetical protein